MLEASKVKPRYHIMDRTHKTVHVIIHTHTHRINKTHNSGFSCELNERNKKKRLKKCTEHEHFYRTSLSMIRAPHKLLFVILYTRMCCVVCVYVNKLTMSSCSQFFETMKFSSNLEASRCFATDGNNILFRLLSRTISDEIESCST